MLTQMCVFIGGAGGQGYLPLEGRHEPWNVRKHFSWDKWHHNCSYFFVVLADCSFWKR